MGPGCNNVGRMSGRIFNDRLFPEGVFYEVYYVHQPYGLIIAEIEYLIAKRLKAFYSPVGYIVDKRKIPRLFAVAEYGYRQTVVYVFCENEYAHVGPSGRAVNRKVSRYAYIKSVKIMIAVAHGFGGLFCGGVRRERSIGHVRFHEGHFIESVEA